MIDCRLPRTARYAKVGLKRVAVNSPLNPGLRDDGLPMLLPAILHEDANLLVAAKPAGLVTHPAYKHPDGTLCDYVFARQAARGESRPWLLHRLDRDTSGVVLFAKTPLARRALVRQFERRLVRKQYLALTYGAPDEPGGVIDAALTRDPADRRRVIIDCAGQPAQTRYRTLEVQGAYALLLAEPLTGRTHQIRAHLASIGAPVAGDTTYLPSESPGLFVAGRTLLHAWRLEILYPGSGEPLALVAPIPDDFAHTARRLGLGAALDRHIQSLQEDSCSLPHSIR